MYRSSYDAISQFLNSTFPSITNIYLNSIPTGYTRPSFFVQLKKESSEDLSRYLYQNNIFWQLVYLAPLDQDGNVDPLDQMSITEQLQQKLMEAMMLTAPDGNQYRILNLDMEFREQALYCTVGMGTLNTRPETQYDLMQIIYNDYKEG